MHQVNLEHLARVVCRDQMNGTEVIYPDTLVGTDSHTTMVNGLGVVGWGVGGIEAEAAMLGQPISMLIPDVVGFRLKGRLPAGTTATDLVLTITERLRQHGVVGKFVEFFGPGLEHLTIADRATLGNMSPEYGATIAIFPIDGMTLDYLRLTGREERHVQLVEAYAKAQGLFRDESAEADYAEILEVDLAAIEPSIAGPRRPQDRVPVTRAKVEFAKVLTQMLTARPPGGSAPRASTTTGSGGSGRDTDQRRGRCRRRGARPRSRLWRAWITAPWWWPRSRAVPIRSNPSVMIGAGLLAKKAVERGLSVKPWVKTSLAPGSMVVTEYLEGGRPARLPGAARVQRGGVRLHDVHWQQRTPTRRRVRRCQGP